MRFEWRTAECLAGTLLYRAPEYSIDFKAESSAVLRERVGSLGSTSLLFGTLQVEIAVETGDLLYPWGLFPRSRWGVARLQKPDFKTGRLRLLPANPLQAGVSHSFPAGDSWRIVRDGISGWICLGDNTVGPETIAVEYATDAGVVLRGDQLVSLWLRPLI